MPYTRIRYHLIFATKYRRRWIDSEVEEFLYPVIRRAAKSAGGRTFRTNGVEDHVHTICTIPPKLAISDFVKTIKTTSSAAVRKTFSRLPWFKWQVGYGCFSLNPLDMDAVFRYVENQKEHHREDELWEEYEMLTEDETKGDEDAHEIIIER